MAEIHKEVAFLNSQPHPKASYYKGVITSKRGKKGTLYEMRDQFGKGMDGALSKPFQILKKNTNKNHWTGEVQDAQVFLLQSDRHHQERGH